ncbi:hypothetical protein GCM10027075_74650 [Streptomyces heilongjiangensis]
MQLQGHHHAACPSGFGRAHFCTPVGTHQDHGALDVCDDGQADVAEEVALHGSRAPGAEHEHLGLRRCSEQCVLGVVGAQVADDGEARVMRLEFRPCVVHEPLR